MIGGGRFASWEERETTEYDWDGDAECRSGSVEMNCVNRRSLMGGGLVIGGGAHLANSSLLLRCPVVTENVTESVSGVLVFAGMLTDDG